MRSKELTDQVVVRVTPALRAALEADAAAHGRTVAQSIRFILTAAAAAGPEGETP